MFYNSTAGGVGISVGYVIQAAMGTFDPFKMEGINFILNRVAWQVEFYALI